jgi:5,10-methylenetetrahydromethanopterin reductase
MDISCAFATSLETPEHIVLAERLGYQRAWCYDSPALYADVWMTLARAAERTSVIGLGPKRGPSWPRCPSPLPSSRSGRPWG